MGREKWIFWLLYTTICALMILFTLFYVDIPMDSKHLFSNLHDYQLTSHIIITVAWVFGSIFILKK
jgi:hypothetical protein